MLTVFNPNADYFKNISLKDCLDGNTVDTHFTIKVYHKLLQEVQKRDLENLYENLLSPLAAVFRDIELEGINVDTDKLEVLKLELESKLEEVKESLKDSYLIPEDINLASNIDLCKILFSVEKRKDQDGEAIWDIVEGIGFGLYPFQYTAKGSPATDADTVMKLYHMVEEEYVKRGLSGKA